MSTITAGGDLFAAGPPFRLEQWLLLRRGDKHLVVREAVFAAALAWLPLAVLTGIHGDFASFMHDIGTHARYLIALPILILAEWKTIPTLGVVARHFVVSGLVREEDMPHFDAAVARTKRLLASKLADVVVILAAFYLAYLWTHSAPRQVVPEWYRGAGGEARSAAGGWHMLMSLPLLLVMILGWTWRVAIWARFLWLTSQLNLRLVPTHPDHAGGLLFTSNSARAFALPAAGLSVIAAGAAAGQVAAGAALSSFTYEIVGAVVITLVLFAFPLLVFSNKLYSRWRDARLTYGMLALRAGWELHRRWVDRPTLPEDLLNTNTFETANNLYAIVGNVYQMRFLPLDKRSVLTLIQAALIPFIPVVLLAVPPDELVRELRRFLI
jgi:hypothetical protein